MKAKILVNIHGYGTAEVSLELVDPSLNDDLVEVWRATFSEKDDPEQLLTDVYFEMQDSDYEIWDLVNAAIHSLHDYLDEID